MKTTPVITTALTLLLVGSCTPAHAGADGYSRDRFGHGYTDEDHDGCDTREELLAAPGPCPPKAVTVSIVDPYTGNRVTGRDRIDVDHIVPLHWFWNHGGSGRTTAERVRFANDAGSPDGVDNTILTAATVNRAKGDRGPSEWLPPDPGARCWYAARWRDLWVEYRVVLPVDDPDRRVVTGILQHC